MSAAASGCPSIATFCGPRLRSRSITNLSSGAFAVNASRASPRNCSVSGSTSNDRSALSNCSFAWSGSIGPPDRWVCAVSGGSPFLGRVAAPAPAASKPLIPSIATASRRLRLMDRSPFPYMVANAPRSGVVGVFMTQSFPVLPLRDIVVFPHMIVPLFVGRDKSVAALESAMAADKEIFLVAQLDPGQDDPGRDDLYDMGVIATILQLLKLPDGTVSVLVEGKARATLTALSGIGDHLTAEVERIDEAPETGVEIAALMRSVVDQFDNYSKLNRKLPAEAAVQMGEIEEPSRLADSIAGNIAIKVADKQALLVELGQSKRLEMVYAFMEGELGVLQVEKKLKSRVKRQMEKTQREYYLNEQLKAIQRELGNEGEEGDGDEIAELTQKIATLKLSKEARTKATAELKKMKTMAPLSAEATVVRNYLDVLLGLPWGKKSKLKKDIAAAQAVLDEDHYALEKVKDRIIEYLAVQARTNKLKGPILCLVGPPGVGKTSLGKSIAKATGREFIRQSLGGVRDEAEIRGHRRTYIGSLPGKIVTNLKKAG